MNFKYEIILSFVFMLSVNSYIEVKATDQFEKLPNDTTIQLMRSYHLAKDLFSVNKKFYQLSHDQQLEHTIGHVIPNSNEFNKIKWFLPSVQVNFGIIPEQINRLKNVRILAINYSYITNSVAFSLDKLTNIYRFDLGEMALAHINQYIVKAQANGQSTQIEDRNAEPALYKIFIKDINKPHRLLAAEQLFHSNSSENDKNFALKTIKKIMMNSEDPDRHHAAVAFCILNSYGSSNKDKNFAFNILSEIMRDPKESNFTFARTLIDSENEEHKNLALNYFRQIVQTRPILSKIPYAEVLLAYGNKEEDRNLCINFLRGIVKFLEIDGYYTAMRLLTQYNNPDNIS